jgi:uncharacterized membrane protein YczE
MPRHDDGDRYRRCITTAPPLAALPVRLRRLAISWLLVSIGVPLMVRADLGVSPFDVLSTGVAEATGWSVGLSFILCSIVCFAVGRLLGGLLGPACIPGTIVIGLLIDVALDVLPQPTVLVARIPMFVAGLLIVAVAITLGVASELGPGPTEVLMLGLMARGMPVVPARWMSDGMPVVVGALLGGAVGAGTLAFWVIMGPLVKHGLQVVGYQPPHVRAERARMAAVGSS